MDFLCGIFLKDPERPVEGELLDLLQATDPADGEAGHCGVEELGAGVAWRAQSKMGRRLARGWNERRDIFIAWLGDDHAFPRSEADIAAWLHQRYEDKGERFILDLEGAFTGVVIDLRARRAFVFNDRFGLGRLYCHESTDAFRFSTSPRPLLAVMPSEDRGIDLRGAAEFMSCGCVLENRTLFRGIRIAPPASLIQATPRQGWRTSAYFDPTAWESQEPLPVDAYYSGLRDIFEESVARCVRQAGSVAMSVTGGVDSRMVMAWARMDPGTLPCYSFSGPFREPLDASLGRRVAAICNQPHQVIPVGDAFLRRFPELAAETVRRSCGAMDVSGAVELYVNGIARDIAPVRLTGNYGGEILRSTIAFSPRSLNALPFTPDFMRLQEEASATYARNRGDHRLSFILFKQLPWHHYSRLSVEQAQLTPRSPYLDNTLIQHAYRVPASHAMTKELSMRLIVDGNPALGNLVTDRGALPAAAGRSRTLREAWIQFTVKAEYALDYGMPQRLAPLNRILSWTRYDRLFLGRHKFYHFRTWYCRQLADFTRDTLGSARACSRPYVDAEGLRAVVARHTAGTGNFTLELHRLLTLELVQREILERLPAGQSAPATGVPALQAMTRP